MGRDQNHRTTVINKPPPLCSKVTRLLRVSVRWEKWHAGEKIQVTSSCFLFLDAKSSVSAAVRVFHRGRGREASTATTLSINLLIVFSESCLVYKMWENVSVFTVSFCLQPRDLQFTVTEEQTSFWETRLLVTSFQLQLSLKGWKQKGCLLEFNRAHKQIHTVW